MMTTPKETHGNIHGLYHMTWRDLSHCYLGKLLPAQLTQVCLFTSLSTIEGDNVSPDISGLIGQHAQGNEPSHHVVYLFNYTDTPYKSQYYVDKIRRELYTDRPDGLCGNEDCGQMSAWYVFSAMGFYPMNPSDGKYQLGTPMFKKVTIKLGQDRKFVIKAKLEKTTNISVKEVLLNGDKLDRTWILMNRKSWMVENWNSC